MTERKPIPPRSPGAIRLTITMDGPKVGRAIIPSHGLAGLIREQQVEPADDLGAIAALWPGDEEPEEVLRFVLSERAERHRIESRQRHEP